MLRLTILVGGLSMLMLVGWLAILRREPATKSNMIAFVSYRDNGRAGLYLMLSDGSNQRRVFVADDTNTRIYDMDWSPDGEWIAFSLTVPPSRNSHIYRIRPDGSGFQQLTQEVRNNLGADWSPNSQKIAYHDGNNLYVMDADGSNPEQITQDGYNLLPSWSPDGEWIAFVRTLPAQNAKLSIHLMRPDGTDLQMQTAGEVNEFNPEWTPDGEQIIFASEPGTNWQSGYYRLRMEDGEIFRMRDQVWQNILNNPVDWSASGKWAVYQRAVGFNQEVFRVRSDGLQVQQLTHHNAEDTFPAWSPPISLDWRIWANILAAIALLFLWRIFPTR